MRDLPSPATQCGDIKEEFTMYCRSSHMFPTKPQQCGQLFTFVEWNSTSFISSFDFHCCDDIRRYSRDNIDE